MFCSFTWHSTTVQDTVTEFDPAPVFLLSPTEIHTLESLVSEHEGAIRIYDSLLDEANLALEQTPDPVSALYYEGLVGNHPDRLRTIQHLQDMKKLRALSWAYRLTRKTPYLDAANHYLMRWINTLTPTGNPINDNKLVSIILAYHLLKNDLEEKKAVEDWMRKMAEAEMASQKSSPKGNWHAKRIKLVAFIGSVLQDQQLLGYAREEYQVYVASSLRPDGTSYDFEKRDALHYHISGLNPMLEIAVALRHEQELYHWQTPEGASLEKSIQFVVPYALGEKMHEEWVNTKVKLDRERWKSGDEYYRPGKAWNPQESLDMFQLAALFDASLQNIVDTLAPEATFTNWTEVLLKTLQTD